MFIDTFVSFGGWLIFGSSWSGVRTGRRRLAQVCLLLTLCLAAHYICAVCYPVVSILVGLIMAVIWILRRMLRTVGTIFFHAQRLVGLAPEAADVDFVGPGTGAVPETASLRGFKRSGDQAKLIVVRRGTATAVFGLGSESQSIRTHGLYVPVEPDTVRGDQSLVERLKNADRVHLCRNIACTEEGGEHFVEYGIVKKFNPERFQSAQAHKGALDAGKTVWAWLKPDVGAGVTRLVGKVKEYASESEAEDTVPCIAGSIRWNGQNGVECLAPSRCTAAGSVFHQVLHEDVPEGMQEVGLCPKHSTQHMSQRTPMKCCVIGCFHEGTKLRSSVRWCVEHCPCDTRPPLRHGEVDRDLELGFRTKGTRLPQRRSRTGMRTTRTTAPVWPSHYCERRQMQEPLVPEPGKGRPRDLPGIHPKPGSTNTWPRLGCWTPQTSMRDVACWRNSWRSMP